jgi:hypothetical protein
MQCSLESRSGDCASEFSYPRDYDSFMLLVSKFPFVPARGSGPHVRLFAHRWNPGVGARRCSLVAVHGLREKDTQRGKRTGGGKRTRIAPGDQRRRSALGDRAERKRIAWLTWGWELKTCTERGDVGPSDGITPIAADELRGLMEKKDLVGGLSDRSGVVGYRGSMR